MVYQWKIPRLYKVDAQIAGEELQRIGKIAGALTPETIVDESRDNTAALHGCFEWDDEVAAECYRKAQAQDLIRNIVTVDIDGEEIPDPVRAFVSIDSDYKPIDVVIKTQSYQGELLQKALSELRNFQRKYSALTQLKDIFDSIERITKAS